MKVIRQDNDKLVLRFSGKLITVLAGLAFSSLGAIGIIFSFKQLLLSSLDDGIKGIAISALILLSGLFMLFLGIISGHIDWIFDGPQGIFTYRQKFLFWKKTREYALREIIAIQISKSPRMYGRKTYWVELCFRNGQVIPTPEASSGTASKQRTAQVIREFLWDAGYFVR